MSKKVLSVGGLAAALSLQNTGLLRPVREEAKNPDLKPCPYCGGKAELREGEECAYVQCLDASYHRGPFVDGDNDAASEAIQAWNQRAEK